MLYLQARSITAKIQDEYKGKNGTFLKVFLISDQRNKNQWRVTWDSIKKNHADFIGKPGIEYTKCQANKCDLDHTDGATYEQSLEIQEPFRVSTIIDTILDEPEHTAYAIHEIIDKKFAERLKTETLYVSPSVWITQGKQELVGNAPVPIIDAWDWKAIHSAWVTEPAFGKDAKITMSCEDDKANCMLRLKPEFGAPIPVLVKHAKAHTYVSVSKDEYAKLNATNFTDQDISHKKCNCELERINDGINLLAMNLRTSEMQMDMQNHIL